MFSKGPVQYHTSMCHLYHCILFFIFQAGKQRLLLLGRSLRQRYVDFIPEIYFPNDVYMLSSDADRCIMSAQSLLAGLYPPSEIQIIEPQLGWQPIPVHTSPRNLDKVGI